MSSIVTSGNVNFSELKSVFNVTTSSVSMSQLYSDGIYATGITGIPTSGSLISVSHFYGKSRKLSQLFTSSTSYTIPANVSVLKIFMVGGGGAGAATHYGGGGSGYITTTTIGNVSAGTSISITIGSGGSRRLNPTNINNVIPQPGGATTVLINSTVYTANGGTGGGYESNTASGNGSSGGGGGGNGGTGGGGGNSGSNGTNGATYIGGTGMGTTNFTNSISFTGTTVYNFRGGSGGNSGNSSHSGGGGGGGIICNETSYPSAENGGSPTYSATGGVGFGAGGGSGGYESSTNTRYYGGAGANGMVYIFN